MNHDEYVVDFLSIETYVGTKPLSISYCGKTIASHNWRSVYSSLCSYLIQDHPEVFRDLLNNSEDNKRAAQIIYDRFDANRLLAPYEIAPGYFIETHRSAYDLIRNIRTLLDICHVPYENVEIRYSIRDKSSVVPKRSDGLEHLYSYARSKAALSVLDPHISLLYCMVQLIRENGYADCDLVLKKHNELTKQKLTKIPGSTEYRDLSEEGFIYAVRVNAGTVSALKFQRPYSELLKDDNYQQLLELLLTADALRQSAAEDKSVSKKQKTPLQKLITRINREIKQKTYLSDILIDEEEYELLKIELNKTIGFAKQSKRLEGSPLFAVGVVQVALRIYQDGNFWGPFFSEIGQPKGDGQEQRLIGTAFYKVLKEYGRFTVEQNRFVQNILLHCFVTDLYMDSYFSFLYAVYTSLLDRDLTQLDRDAMNALVERADRSNLLVTNTAEAFKANPRGAKIRIRNHLKLLDKLFWNPDYTLRTSNRIYSKLQLWARHSDKLILESASGRSSGTKGKKRFSKPYLFFDQMQFAFRLVFPQQIVIGDDPDLHWEISGQIAKTIVPDIVEAVVGYKVQECSLNLDSWQDLLGDFKIKLKDHEDGTIRSFSLPKTNVRFFDEEGYLIFTNQLHAGMTFAVSERKTALRSSSLAETHEYQEIVLSAFQFEDHDILMLPNGHAVSIGGETIQSGLAGNTAVSGINCVLQDDAVVPLMSKFPHIILRMAEVKAPGTCIEINAERFSLADVASMTFPIDDRSGDTGYWIEMDKVITAHNGVYSVLADIPGGSTFAWKFVYVDKFEMTFEESPYVFEPRGVVRFRDNITIRSLEKGCQKDAGGNIFRFELAKVGRSIDFAYEQANFSCILKANVPALFLSFDGEKWSAKKPELIWYTDLPEIIYIQYPQSKISLFTDILDDDTAENEEDEEKVYIKPKKDSFFRCDIRWLQSYLHGKTNIHNLYFKSENVSKELLQIVRHNIVCSCTIKEVGHGNGISIQTTILGKNPCCADIKCGDTMLAEKVAFNRNSLYIPTHVRNEHYSVELFEEEEDESGFGTTELYSIGVFHADLSNPFDLSNRSIRIKTVEIENNEPLELLLSYYVENLKRTGSENGYTGMMVVEDSNKKLAAIAVQLDFLDIENPDTVHLRLKNSIEKPFLYDLRRKFLVTEENQSLSEAARAQRYLKLDPDKTSYRIIFVERSNSDYSKISTRLVIKEYSIASVFSWKEPSSQAENKGGTFGKNRKQAGPILVRNVTWSRYAYPEVMLTGIQTIDEFRKWTREQLKHRFQMSDSVLDSIETTLSVYGVRLANQKRVSPQSDAQTEMDSSKIMPEPLIQKQKEKDQREQTLAVEAKPNIEIAEASAESPLSALNLGNITLNCLRQAGYSHIEQLLALYEKKGTKGFGNIPRFNSEMQRELIKALRREKLI